MLKIKYIRFNEYTGYGIAANNLIAALTNAGAEVSIVNILPGSVDSGGILCSESSSLSLADHDVVIIHTVPEYYPYWYNYFKIKNRSLSIWGYTAWETSRIPDHWIALINQLDGVFVPSSWNKTIFIKSGISIRVEVLPHISEFSINNSADSLEKAKHELDTFDQEHFIFYSINVWNLRKNNETIIRAFLDEFSEDEHVGLIIKTGDRDWNSLGRRLKNLFRKRYENSSYAFMKIVTRNRLHQIKHIWKNLPPEEIRILHEQCHCYVSTTRGEGWGMGAFEAAFLARPVIITGIGGQLDFLPRELSYHIPFKLVHVPKGREDAFSYREDQVWAEADLAETRRLMRYVFSNQAEAKKKGEQLSAYVQEQFNPAQIAKSLIDLLNG